MRLGELLNKISRKRSQPEIEDRKMAEDIYKASEHVSAEENRFEKVEEKIITEQTDKPLTWKEKLQAKNINIIIAVGVVIGAVLIALFMVLYVRLSNSAFKEDKVAVSIEGAEVVDVGGLAEYKITVENKNRSKLQDVSLSIDLPRNFSLQENPVIVDKNLSGAKISVGDLKGHSKKQYTIKSIVNYSGDAQEALKIFARYKPSNISSYFQSSVQKNIKLAKTNIEILVDSTGTASNGEMISMDLVMKNNSADNLEGLSLEINYPEGFIFDHSNLTPLEDKTNKWIVNTLKAGEQYKINIQGTLSGRLDAIKAFKIVLKNNKNNSVLAQTESSIKIIPSKILLKEVAQESNVYPGGYIDYTVLFRNNSTVPLRNLVLKTHLPGKYIERSKVTSTDGYYDSRENIITWKAGDFSKLQNLQPGEEGKVEFRVGLMDGIIPKDKNDKNPYLRSYSEIESLDVDSPLFENKKVTSTKLKIPINSVVQVASVANYMPENGDTATEGILKVDQKTKIKITLALSNTTNRLKGAKLLADLPSGTNWEGQIYPEGDNLKFNERSHQLEWNMGSIEVGTGILSPPEKAEFIISVVPSVNQVNQGIDLLKNIKVGAKDTFTNANIGYEFKAITSQVVKGLKDGLVQN